MVNSGDCPVIGNRQLVIGKLRTSSFLLPITYSLLAFL